VAVREEERVEPALVGAARLRERVDLARRIHDRVIQRLCGVSLALESPLPLGPGDRARCGRELASALAELRAVLSDGLPPEGAQAPASLAELADSAARAHPGLPVELELPAGVEVGAPLPLVRRFLDEALRNAGRHGRPTRVLVSARNRRGRLELAVRNDGALAPGDPPGIGLRLLRLEVSEWGARIEAGPCGPGEWLASLSLPHAEPAPLD
jgi:signal transduction histidine kinase